ncbi:hypothetical protein LCGC14_0556790 [marine sediment metagenome]|uniref:Uncharacterized protein n=1 Tax=marine sediment metagenome TaxID=412755 RepID=A0A0F9U9Q0_9ZZZZ
MPEEKLNVKYKLLKESLKAIKEGAIKLLILKGEAGFGKTYNSMAFAKDNKINYRYINTYATPLAFYKLLYENRGRDLIIFDDLQSINDPKIKSMFKAACWESDGNKRIINYHSTSAILEKEQLPDSFEFKSKIILIFNKEFQNFTTIVNRGIIIDFSFNFKEKLEIFDFFKKHADIDDEVLEYVKKNCNQATQNLSIRTLKILSILKRKNYDYELFAKEILCIDDDLNDLLMLSDIKWKDETGLSRATYYNRKKKLK